MQGVSVLDYFKKFFSEIVKGRRDYEHLLPLTILSAFGCISFVLVLGKLNSNFLSVPRVFMLILYVYAVAQAYSLFYQRIPQPKPDSEFQPIIEVMKYIYPWVIFLGKITLLITLSWILNKKRLIFYIVNKSLSMTLVKEQLKEFNRYME